MTYFVLGLQSCYFASVRLHGWFHNDTSYKNCTELNNLHNLEVKVIFNGWRLCGDTDKVKAKKASIDSNIVEKKLGKKGVKVRCIKWGRKVHNLKKISLI